MKSRREFIENSLLASVGIGISPQFIPFVGKKKNSDTVNIGFIGTGLRGRNHINNLLRNEDVRCSAICDIDPKAINESVKLFEKYGHPLPKTYQSGENAYLEMLEKEDLDGVIISTNWKWHSPIVLASLEAGIFTGVEVSGAFSVDECWEWVRMHERTKSELFFLENVCYRRDVMAVLNMVRANVFGELLHCRGGYQHDLRHVKFDDGKGGLIFGENAISEAKWRTQHSLERNAELYPTHGLGPIIHQLNVNRGNRLLTVSSHATKSRSLKNYVQNHAEGGKNHPYYELDWKLGDIVTSTITTSLGETIILTHDTNSPRPYSLGFRTQGSKGLIEFDYYDQRIYVEGISPSHQWEDTKNWFEKYDHPLWKKYGQVAEGSGHGGMDYFLDRQFVADVKNKSKASIDVYDAVAMKVITPLSEASILAGGAPQNIPDFTSGKWMTEKPTFALNNDF